MNNTEGFVKMFLADLDGTLKGQFQKKSYPMAYFEKNGQKIPHYDDDDVEVSNLVSASDVQP